jgi:hypothetical protein
MSEDLITPEAQKYEELKRKGNSKTKEEKAEFEKLSKLMSLPEEGQGPAPAADSVAISREDFDAFMSEMKTLKDQVASMKSDKRAGVETDEAQDYDDAPKVYQARIKVWQPKITDEPKIFTNWVFLGETYNAKGQLELEYEYTLRDRAGKEEKVVMLYSTFAKISKYLTVDVLKIDKTPDKKSQGKVYRRVQEEEDQVQTKEVVTLVVKQEKIMVTLLVPEFGEIVLEEKYINN